MCSLQELVKRKQQPRKCYTLKRLAKKEPALALALNKMEGHNEFGLTCSQVLATLEMAFREPSTPALNTDEQDRLLSPYRLVSPLSESTLCKICSYVVLISSSSFQLMNKKEGKNAGGAIDRLIQTNRLPSKTKGESEAFLSELNSDSDPQSLEPLFKRAKLTTDPFKEKASNLLSDLKLW